MKIHWTRILVVVVSVFIVLIVVLLAGLLFKDETPKLLTEEEFVQSGHKTGEASESVSADNHRQQTSAPTSELRRAWTERNIEEVQALLVPPYKEHVENASLVQLAPDMQLWKQDDQFLITIPQTREQFLVTIAEVSSTLGNNRSYKGKLLDGEHSFSYLITVGERNVFANFKTSKGSFELVGNTHYAWLMPTENMDLHVDYTQDDFFIPEFENDPH